MKSFFRRLFIFSFTFFFLASLVTLLYYLSTRNKVQASLKEIAGHNIVIMGDSQLQRLKPDLFEESTFNFASSGEHFYFTYEKLKDLVAIEDHSIQKVIIGISLSSYGSAYNRLYDLNFSEGRGSLEKYLYFIDMTQSSFFKPKDVFKKNVFKSLIEGIYKDPDWGGLIVSKEQDPDSTIVNKIFDIHYEVKENENLLAVDQITYLNKIDRLCKENSIDLYLVSGPLDPLYKKKTNELYYNVLKNSIENLDQVKYINYLNENVHSSLLSDAVHLNSKGADIYSKRINDSIRKLKK